MLVYRVFWQALNTNARPVHATARVAAVELAVFLLVSAGALIPALPMALLPWLAYVVRPVGGLAVSLSTGIPPENL
jgi:VIT1/CCC1 family predicted Fe2+/Mn2+ transporter